MSQIAEQVKTLLLSPLHAVVDARVEAGVREYGQTLDQNVKSEREKAVHQLQELIDALQYECWRQPQTEAGREAQELRASRLAGLANDLLREHPDLTLEEMLHKEGHSGESITLPREMIRHVADTLAALEGVLDTSVERVVSLGGRAPESTPEQVRAAWEALGAAFAHVHPGRAFHTLLASDPRGLEVVIARCRVTRRMLRGPRILVVRDTYEEVAG